MKRRLHITHDLHDFYNFFCDDVSNLRSKENGEDHRYNKDNVEMVFPSIDILNHIVYVYTIETFFMFEKEFIDDVGYKYNELQISTCNRLFEVWGVRVGNRSHI